MTTRDKAKVWRLKADYPVTALQAHDIEVAFCAGYALAEAETYPHKLVEAAQDVIFLNWRVAPGLKHHRALDRLLMALDKITRDR